MSTSSDKPQNVYDDPKFFAGYATLPRSVEGLTGAPEWPTVRDLLPALRGARILDLGCGFGAFDRWAVEQGAAHVVAVDLSEKMLQRARALSTSGSIEYRRGDIAHLDVPERNFDLIYSGLALHYVEDFAALCRRMRAKLRAGGRLVATIEHPIFSAPSVDEWREQDGRTVWPLDNYLIEGWRTRTWFAEGVLKYHRTVATYVNDLVANGFSLVRLVEWGPDAAQVTAHPDWAREVHRPMFLLIAADAAA